MKQTFRIWPHRVKGEGHYLARLRRGGEAREHTRMLPSFMRDKQAEKLYREFADRNLVPDHPLVRAGRLILFGDQLYRLPDGMLSLGGLKVVRSAFGNC